MKNLALPLLGTALLLASCGGGGSTPPAGTVSTLYQGVWGWGIVEPTTGELIDNGAVVYDDETNNAGRTAAFGGYINVAQTRQGYSILGPITAVGQLEVGFTVDTNPNNPNVYFIGTDDDNQFGVYENKSTFEGSGVVFNASGQPEKNVGVILIQTSTSVPTGMTAQAQAKAQARAVVSQRASQAKFKTKTTALNLSAWKDGFLQAIRQR